jgi:hypothetical protein
MTIPATLTGMGSRTPSQIAPDGMGTDPATRRQRMLSIPRNQVAVAATESRPRAGGPLAPNRRFNP